MPTLPSRSAAAAEPHRARHIAESFGSDPGRYDRSRPRYPQALVDRIIAASPGRDVLDVGIGTGISARPFRAAGCRVLGVEVDERMAEFARREGFDVEVAAFEDWDAAGRTFDAIIAGMTWHWVDPVAGAKKAAQVLRPGGRLAVFWYVAQPPSGLARAFSAVYRRVLPDTPFANAPRDPVAAYERLLSHAEDAMPATLSEPERWQFDWHQRYTKAQWLEQVPTFGGHSQVEPAQLEELLAGLGAAIDALGDGFTMKYTALAATARRRHDPA